MITRRVFLATATTSLAAPAFAQSPQQAPQQGLKSPRSNFLTFQPQFMGVFRSPVPGLTYSSLYNLESPPDLIRLVYRNDIREDETIDGAVIAPTAMMGDGFTPYGADGKPDNSLWKRVTFSGGDADTPPRAASSRASETTTIYGDASWGKNPGPSTFSDWIPVQALDRKDGGKGTLLLVRTFSKGLFRNQFVRFQKISGDPVNRVYAGFASPGDATQAPWSFTAEPNEIPAALAIQYRTAAPGASVMFAGDSILAPPHTYSIGLRTCTLASTPQVPVSFVNQAHLGAKTVEYVTAARREMTWSRPQILVLQPWSTNDPDMTDAKLDDALDMSMKLVSFALKNQCAPVLVTQPPQAPYPAVEPFRQRSNAFVRDAASKGLTLFDLDKLWSSETAPGTFRKGYSPDQVHGSDVACAAAAQVLAPVIRNLLA
ncbi:MAG TPA: hypothetical protein VN175_12310 [Rhizomicrobium sp.]|nr:hypothetical protein [Rhizomicrobium sp.]